MKATCRVTFIHSQLYRNSATYFSDSKPGFDI